MFVYNLYIMLQNTHVMYIESISQGDARVKTEITFSLSCEQL